MNNASAQLQPGDRVAIIGDSITEQKMYSVFLEDYLLMCKPAENVTTMQFGWGGETAKDFLARAPLECLQFKPTIATTSFGMNDGGYIAIDAKRVADYTAAVNGIADAFKAADCRLVLGGPGCVDPTHLRTFVGTSGEVYNKTLGNERDIARKIAADRSAIFADVHETMLTALTRAKDKYGQEYLMVGDDGIHPRNAGHLAMAHAYLKALGCDGEVGTISVDLAAHSATASAGHQIVSCADGTVLVESARYPFCFLVEPKFASKLDDPSNVRSILPVLPFNAELNRFVLIVRGAPEGAKLKVTWGAASKSYSAEQLAKGVNLADEFLDNPFVEAFAAVDAKVREQQNFETTMIKSLVHNVYHELPDAQDAQRAVVAACVAKQQALSKAAVDAVRPLTHRITVEIEK